jgi:ketosteroid isomerase-like protein
MEHLMTDVDQDRAGADVAAIAAGIDDMYDAFLAGDRARFDTHLHPGVTTWESHLPDLLPDRAALDAHRDRRDAAGARPALSRLAAERMRVDAWGDTGLARYLLAAEPAGGDPVRRYRVTDVLRRTDGAWRIVHHHAERVRREPG